MPAVGIVLPGLVNAHTHLAMTMFRGLADDLDLDGFLGRLMPAEGTVLTEATVAAGTALAVAECLRAGITTALDMYFFPEAAGAVAAPTGFQLAERARVRRVPRRRPPPVPPPARVGRGAAARRPHRGTAASARTAPTCCRRTSCGPSASWPASTAAGVHVHACETAAELAQVAGQHGGRTPIEVLRDTGLLGPGTVLAHGVHLTRR